MRVLESPSIAMLEKVVVNSKKDFVFVLAYLRSSQGKNQPEYNEVIKKVKEYVGQKKDADFFEAIIYEKDKDARKQFEVSKYPTLMVFSGGLLLYKTFLPTTDKVEAVMSVVKTLPKLEFGGGVASSAT